MTEEEANTWLELSRAAQMGLPALGFDKLGLTPGGWWADKRADLKLLRRFPEGSLIQTREDIEELEGRHVDYTHRNTATEQDWRQEAESWD